MTAATMKINSTLPAAFASAHTASSAIGSSTSWTQRGTTTRGGSGLRRRDAAGRLRRRESVSSRSCLLGGAASGAFVGDAAHLPRHHRQSMAEPEAAAAGPPSAVSILFVGDLVGGIGRRTLLDCLPLLRERYAPTFVVVNGENVAGGPGDHPEDRRRSCSRPASTRSRSATTPTTAARSIPTSKPQPRIVRPANFLRSQPGRGTCVVEHDGVRLGVVNMSGNLYLRAGRSAFTEIEVALGELGRGRPRARRHARRGDLREGRDGLAPRRAGDGRRGHPHARAHRRRARAARRDRLHHRRRHDRPARRRDRRQARAGDRVAADADARSLRNLRGGPVADGSAHPLLAATAGRLASSRC